MSDYPRDQQDAYELDQRHRKQAEEPRGVELSADAAGDALSAFLRKKLAAADLEARHNLGHDFDCPGCGFEITKGESMIGRCECPATVNSAEARTVTVREWFRSSRRATFERDTDAWRKWDELAEAALRPYRLADRFPKPARNYSIALDLLEHLCRQIDFSYATFGPGRLQGVIDHIRKELVEIEAEPHDLEEWIDVVILALDGAWRSGARADQVVEALIAKQTKNERREWPDWRTFGQDKAIEHVRDNSDDSGVRRVAVNLARGRSDLQPLYDYLNTLGDDRDGGVRLSVADILRTPEEGQRRAKEILDGMAADFRRDIPNMFTYLGRRVGIDAGAPGGDVTVEQFYRGRAFRALPRTIQNPPNVVALRDELAEFIRARMPWTWADIDRDGGEALDTALLMAEPIAANLAAEFAEMRDDQGYVPLMPQLRASVRDATPAEQRIARASVAEGYDFPQGDCDLLCVNRWRAGHGHCRHGKTTADQARDTVQALGISTPPAADGSYVKDGTSFNVGPDPLNDPDWRDKLPKGHRGRVGVIGMAHLGALLASSGATLHTADGLQGSAPEPPEEPPIVGEPCDLECGDRFFHGKPTCRHGRTMAESAASLHPSLRETFDRLQSPQPPIAPPPSRDPGRRQ